jgi:hypothetical protein
MDGYLGSVSIPVIPELLIVVGLNHRLNIFQSITVFTDVAPSSFVNGYSEEFLRKPETYLQNYITFQKAVFLTVNSVMTNPKEGIIINVQ